MKEELNITYQDRELLRKFFISVFDWMLNHMTPNRNELKEFIQMYENFLTEKKLKNNKVLKIFLLELKEDLLKKSFDEKTLKVTNYEVKTLQNPLFIQNGIIAKWYRESRLNRHLLNVSIDAYKKVRIPVYDKLKKGTI